MFRLTPEQQQQHAVMLLQHYHELCHINDPSYMFVSPPPIPNIGSLSQSDLSSLDSASFGRNRAGMNIQQPHTSEVEDIETVMAYNEDLNPPPPQDISNVFSSADLSAQSSYHKAKYKRAWYKARVTRSSFLSAGESPLIIPEGDLVCADKFMNPTRITSYLYHDPDEAIPFMVRFKKVVMPFIE